MILFPNAKINLGLYIVGRRDDGYHDLSTAFYPIGWTDILEIVPAKGPATTLTVTGRTVDCPTEKNLVMRAYRALEREAALPPVDIFLHKIIPDGAGLGGGSADAAFTLTGLNEMFALGLSRERLAEIASTLGADCPFFIYDRPTMASGIGDVFSPLDISLKGMSVVVAKPQVHVSTREAYAGVTPRQPDYPLRDTLEHTPVESWQQRVANDFEATVAAAHPEIAAVKRALAGAGAIYTSMSGSGAAVYGIFQGSDILAGCAGLRRALEGCDTYEGVFAV